MKNPQEIYIREKPSWTSSVYQYLYYVYQHYSYKMVVPSKLPINLVPHENIVIASMTTADLEERWLSVDLIQEDFLSINNKTQMQYAKRVK